MVPENKFDSRFFILSGRATCKPRWRLVKVESTILEGLLLQLRFLLGRFSTLLLHSKLKNLGRYGLT